MEVLVVKSQLGEDFRRFTVPRQVRLLSLVGLLQKLYGYDGSKNDLLLKYKDDEGPYFLLPIILSSDAFFLGFIALRILLSLPSPIL